MTTAAEALVLAETVGHPNFGIHLDAAALAISGEITVETLWPLMRHVRHFHISEVDLAPVGTTTTVPHAAIGRALRDVGYGGWCSIEMRTTPGDPWQAALPRALAVARAHYTG